MNKEKEEYKISEQWYLDNVKIVSHCERHDCPIVEIKDVHYLCADVLRQLYEKLRNK